MDELLAAIKRAVFGKRRHARLMIPYDMGAITSHLCENAEIISMEYEPDGTVLEGNFEPDDFDKYERFVIDGKE